MDKPCINTAFILLANVDNWRNTSSPILSLVSNLLTIFLIYETKVDSFDLQMKYFCGSGTMGSRGLWLKKKKKKKKRCSWGCSEWRIWHCHCWGTGWIPDPRNFHIASAWQKKKCRYDVISQKGFEKVGPSFQTGTRSSKIHTSELRKYWNSITKTKEC